MRVSFSSNNAGACQPLRPIAFKAGQGNVQKTSAEYEKQISELRNQCELNRIKYETACMFAARPSSIDTFIKNIKK